MTKITLHSTRVLTSEGLTDASIFVENGKITAIEKGLAKREGYTFEDCKNAVIMPALIDAHVHINEPGRTEWEGFDTATKAAAAGGIGTLIDMPLNSTPVTTTVAALKEKQSAAKGKIHVNCGFWGGVVPDNVGDLDALLAAGVFGIKAFLTHSGIDDFPNVTEADLRKALPILKRHNVMLLVHCELDEAHEDLTLLENNPTSYAAYLKSRPRAWEDNAIDLMIRLCKEFDVKIHIVHLSSSNSISNIQIAKNQGLQLTTETCPQYLFFNAENIPDAATAFKCAPPIREAENNEQLWNALKNGTIDFIVTDHSPAPPELKAIDSGNFKTAWGGIAGLQFSLPVVWTKAKEKGFSIADISRLMTTNIARFLNLEDKKGKIQEGYDADLVVWHPEAEFTVTKDIIQHRHKVTPYENLTLSGVVEKTFIGGHKVYDSGAFLALGKGQILDKL